ncbi:thioester domain-containing protein [Fodinicola acaciae]|uniref:thioester domain-containing protein n=1 Tax=Fodinicola acaciae TaxID=2681555 RepID=UPI0013D5E58D|nr:thioester domain-containing protein [Fodinicola acaciae]
MIGFAANPVQADEGVTGKFLGSGTSGGNVYLNGGDKAYTALLQIKLDKGEVLNTYCIDQKTHTQSGAPMVEDDWSTYPEDNKFKTQPEKVNWILQNSYPHVSDLAALAKAAGIDSLKTSEAIAGTQAAIWHFSNGVELDAKKNKPNVVKLYDYLTGAKNTGIKVQPAPSLQITPDKATGESGDKIGPFTVKTSESSVPLTVDSKTKGVTLVDKNGKVVKSAANGGKVYLKVPANADAGTATITGALKEADIQTGRLFRGTKVKTQTLIVATTTKAKAEKSVEASWKKGTQPSESPSASTPAPSTPAPSTSPAGGSLPVTGTNVALFAGVGAVLLLIGGGLFLVARKRRA